MFDACAADFGPKKLIFMKKSYFATPVERIRAQNEYYQAESSLERVLETLLDFIQTTLRHHLGSIGLHFGSIFCAQKDEP